MPGLIDSRELLNVERAEDGNFVGVCAFCGAQVVIEPLYVLNDAMPDVGVAGGCEHCGQPFDAVLPLCVTVSEVEACS